MEILSPAATPVAACAEGRAVPADAELARLHAQVASLQAEREALRWAAGHDELTGLPNRRLFYTLAPPRLGADGRSTAVIVMDLDGFKPINDHHGHATGDHVLRIVAYRLASWAGDNLVARFGGDEFAALLSCPGPQTYGKWWYPSIMTLAAVIAEPIPVGGHTVAVTASIGIAPSYGSAMIGELLHQADMAMYEAKRHAKLTGSAGTAWALDNTGGHETITLHAGSAPKAIPAAPAVEEAVAWEPAERVPSKHEEALGGTVAGRPNVVELTIFQARPGSAAGKNGERQARADVRAGSEAQIRVMSDVRAGVAGTVPATVSGTVPGTVPATVPAMVPAKRDPSATRPACGDPVVTAAPRARMPACVVPASAYRAGDPVWVFRNGAWRPGVVECASESAVLARYRCADGPGTGVDTIPADQISHRTDADPQLDLAYPRRRAA